MRQRAGFTLVEVLVAATILVVALLGILAAIAIPQLVGGIQRSGVDGASRRLAEDIRLAQSSAITRGLQARILAFDATGAAPYPGGTAVSDATKANNYRLEVRTGATAAWPTLSDTPASNSNVLTAWQDLAGQYRGVTVTTGNTLLFNSQGFLVNSAVTLSIGLQGSGGTKTVATSIIGKATIQ